MRILILFMLSGAVALGQDAPVLTHVTVPIAPADSARLAQAKDKIRLAQEGLTALENSIKEKLAPGSTAPPVAPRYLLTNNKGNCTYRRSEVALSGDTAMITTVAVNICSK